MNSSVVELSHTIIVNVLIILGSGGNLMLYLRLYTFS